jgi:hypothetical protein
MLISQNHKFIFVHVPKVAGQSVTNALLPFCLSSYELPIAKLFGASNYIKINTKFRKYLGFNLYAHAFSDHVNAQTLRGSLGNSFDDYFKFAFVRNPWGWIYSHYTYALKNKRHFRHQFIRSKFSDFNAFVEWLCLEKEDRKLQKSYLCDDAGELLVDYVGRHETIHQDFLAICESIGVNVSLPHLNQSASVDYRQYYSSRARDLVQSTYAEDIALFDYEF